MAHYLIIFTQFISSNDVRVTSTWYFCLYQHIPSPNVLTYRDNISNRCLWDTLCWRTYLRVNIYGGNDCVLEFERLSKGKKIISFLTESRHRQKKLPITWDEEWKIRSRNDALWTTQYIRIHVRMNKQAKKQTQYLNKQTKKQYVGEQNCVITHAKIFYSRLLSQRIPFEKFLPLPAANYSPTTLLVSWGRVFFYWPRLCWHYINVHLSPHGLYVAPWFIFIKIDMPLDPWRDAARGIFT